MASSQKDRDHNEIREWVEQRGGRPARVTGTGGLLRIDFGEQDEKLEPITWEEFFEKFDESEITLLHETRPEGRFNKLVRGADESA